MVLRLSNKVIAALNLLTLLMACGALSYSSWLYVRVKSPCEKTLRKPLLAAGGAMLVVSLAGLLGSCCRLPLFMWLYLAMLFLLIVGLTAFTIFGVIVTHGRFGPAPSGNRKLGGYSAWLKNHVLNQENWDKLRTCLVRANICSGVRADEELHYKHKLSPIEWGCCKPPKDCQLQVQNGTAGMEDPDCERWGNDRKQLCFGCESCKAAALEDIRSEWRALAIVNACVVVFVSVIYFIACCALRNTQRFGYTRFGNDHDDFSP